MEEFFHVPPNKPRRILIVTTEEKHSQLRYIKALLNKTWEELLVDFVITIFNEMEKTGIEGIAKAFREEVEKNKRSNK